MDENVKKMLENLGININIDAAGIGLAGLKSGIKYTQNTTSHILQITIDPRVTKEQIKARLAEPGTIQVEWPKIEKAEEIPVQ